jgi:hypothetical protein
MWTVLYWTRSSRTQFGVSINVWRLAGDALNIACNFLCCNHQVHREFLITLYLCLLVEKNICIFTVTVVVTDVQSALMSFTKRCVNTISKLWCMLRQFRWESGLRPFAWWDYGLESRRGNEMSVCCECCVLSGSLCERPITRPEESYRVWCVWV